MTYNDGFLGQENEDYQAWILDKKHWGGAIELSILSKHYGRVIAAYDIQTKRCDRCAHVLLRTWRRQQQQHWQQQHKGWQQGKLVAARSSKPGRGLAE